MLILFKGEKTSIFWAGLTTLGLASVFLLETIVRLRYASTLITAEEGLTDFIWSTIPMIVGEIVFIVIGLLMMRSGVRRNQPQ